MTTRPEIALQQRPSGFNLINSLTGAQNVVERFRTADFRKAILEGQANQVQQQNALSGVSHAVKVLEGLQSVPLDQRAALVAQQLPVFEQLGIPASQITSQNLSDAGIEQRLATLRPIVSASSGASTAAQQNFEFFNRIISDPSSTPDQVLSAKIELGTAPRAGRSQLQETAVDGVFRVFDPNTQALSDPVRRDDSGQLVPLTRDEQLELSLAEQQAEIGARGEAETAVQLTRSELLAEVERKLKRGEQLDSIQIVRLDEAVQQGLTAVGSLPDVNRGLELLKTVNTGGLDARAKVITDFFGTTSGDVGELNNILARNVLDGLSAFTGAISEGERAFIEKMNTNLAAGTEFNIAQLNRLRNIYQREIEKGLKAAKQLDDDFSIELFQDAIEADPSGFSGDFARQTEENRSFVDSL